MNQIANLLARNLQSLDIVCVQEQDAMFFHDSDQVARLGVHKRRLLSSIRRLTEALQTAGEDIPDMIRDLAGRCREHNAATQTMLHSAVAAIDHR